MTLNWLSRTEQLKLTLRGNVFTPEEAGFAEAAAVWNKTITKQPDIVVMPENTEDIIDTVKFARQYNIPLAVKGGGHDWAGRSVGEGGIQINMRRMNRIDVNPSEKTAVVQGGATSMEVIRAAETHRLLPVTGTHDSVGYVGLTLGGGYGPLSSSLGLAIDNVIGADIILDDGTFCRVDEETYPDLFWAIRGGGGNFGVVVSLTIRLYDVKPILTGIILFRDSDAGKILRGFNDIMVNAPDNLTVDSGVMHTPDGKVVAYLIPFWFGESSPEREKHIEALKQLATPIQAEIYETSYSELIASLSNNQRKSAPCYALQSRSLPALDNNVINTIVNAVSHSSSPYSLVNIHNNHGAPTRLPADYTPFPIRKPHYMVEIIASWNLGDENAQQHEAWATALFEALQPTAFPGGYANIIGPDESEQIAEVFGDNLQQLKKIKKKYDPANVFQGIGIFRQ